MNGNTTKDKIPSPNEWVISSFDQLKKRNPKYSLRSFARDIGINASHLGQFLNGNEGLSLDKAHKIALKLKWDDKKTQQFLALTQIYYGRTKKQKIQGQLIWKNINRTPDYQLLKKDSFAFISDWYHMAILELADIKDFDSNPTWISEKLGITLDEVTEALKRLKRLELIEYLENGEWKPTLSSTSTEDDVSSDAVQKFHCQLSKVFQKRISSQNLDTREVQSFVFAVSKKQIPLLKSKIRQFCEELMTEVNTNEPKDDVYAFSTQLFSLMVDDTKNEVKS